MTDKTAFTVNIVWKDKSTSTYEVQGCYMSDPLGWVSLYFNNSRSKVYFNRDEILSVTLPDIPPPPPPREEALPEEAAEEEE